MTMPRATVHRFTITNPGDVSTVAVAIDRALFDPAHVVAAIGKTPGNGLVNDYTRGFLTLTLADLLATRTGRSRADILARIPFVFSGGVERVLTPHVARFCAEPFASVPQASASPRLAVGTAISRPLQPHEIGAEAQIALTADTVLAAMREAMIDDPKAVYFVQVKAPCLTAEATAEDGMSARDLRPPSCPRPPLDRRGSYRR